MAASISASLAVAAPASAPSSSFCESKGVASLKPAASSLFAGKQLTTVSNGSRVNCMQVWPPYNNHKYETLSYLPPLTDEQVVAQVEYIVRKGWIPCLEFDRIGNVYREHFHGSGYYDGRYWTMWKLPMFGCTDASIVLREIKECQKAYPDCYIRVLGFDNRRQVQVCGFLVQKPQ